MLFPSREFLFYFLPLLLLGYYLLPFRGRRLLLTVAGYFFYGWWNPAYVLLLLASTVMDFHFARIIHQSEKPATRKLFLILSVVANLGYLGFFKYFMFLNQTVAGVWSLVGLTYPPSLLDVRIVLPIGISFYTFQSMSYIIDVYRRTIPPAKSIAQYACFLAMFPQLIAGPIVRYHDLADQLPKPDLSMARFYAGLQFFILGMAKKVLLADNISPLADRFFDAPNLAAFSSLDALLAAVAYSLQIYFDFSGYSDMAVGLGQMLGFEYPQNFHSPYKSASVTEFWRRWHMTLSHWLRDYLYISLGGNRQSRRATYRNLVLTMLLGGLWHGANWTFVLWGGWHGLWLAIERALGKRNPLRRLPRPLQVVWTCGLVFLGWIVFRAGNLTRAGEALAKLFAADGGPSLLLRGHPLSLLMGGVGLAVVFGCRNTWEFGRAPSVAKTAALALLFALSLLFVFGSVTHPFLYFQF